jgi:hypothetical protein
MDLKIVPGDLSDPHVDLEKKRSTMSLDWELDLVLFESIKINFFIFLTSNSVDN